VSSGAIVSVALSAVLETKEQNITNGFSFGDLHNLLFTLQNSDIYSSNVFKVISHLSDGYLLDTTPLRTFLQKVLYKVNYSTLGDVYLPTTITTVDQRTGASLRLHSTNPLYSSLSLLDVLLCSTAIPVAFQPGTLPQISPYSYFLDGATGIDGVPVVPLFDIPGLQAAYVITFNYAITSGIIDNSLPFDSADNTLLKFALQAFDILRANVAIGAIEVLKGANFSSYVYEPNFTTTFSTVDFGSEETQYNLAKDWASKNDPVSAQLYSLRSSFLPNYTLINEELSKSSGSHTTSFFSSFFWSILCIAVAAGAWNYRRKIF